MAVLAREVDDGRRSQPAVEVVVQERLGRLADGRLAEHASSPYTGGSTGPGLPYVGRAPWAPEAQRTPFAISRRIPGSK